MKILGLRNMIFIGTKYTINYRRYQEQSGRAVNYGGNSKKSMFLSLEASLKKLQTDYIDLFYVHLWDWSTSIPEIMDSLDILVKQGKVLYLGVSDTPAWGVSAANYYARAHRKTPLSVYQGRWNIVDRGFEREIVPIARHYGMARNCSRRLREKHVPQTAMEVEKILNLLKVLLLVMLWRGLLHVVVLRAFNRLRSPIFAARLRTFSLLSVDGKSLISRTILRPWMSLLPRTRLLPSIHFSNLTLAFLWNLSAKILALVPYDLRFSTLFLGLI